MITAHDLTPAVTPAGKRSPAGYAIFAQIEADSYVSLRKSRERACR